jgi:hypothetical protein
MKTFLASLVVLAGMTLFAGASDAQRISTSFERGVRPSYHSRGYAHSRVWVPGRYETVRERVWIPGSCERVWVPPAFELRYVGCGRAVRVMVRAGCWETVQHPGHYEERCVRVWRPGYWTPRC